MNQSDQRQAPFNWFQRSVDTRDIAWDRLIGLLAGISLVLITFTFGILGFVLMVSIVAGGDPVELDMAIMAGICVGMFGLVPAGVRLVAGRPRRDGGLMSRPFIALFGVFMAGAGFLLFQDRSYFSGLFSIPFGAGCVYLSYLRRGINGLEAEAD